MTGRILVVDDVATNRIVMKVKLSAACYTVLQADCGEAALRIARAEKPDLILLDVMMPDLSGVAVCERLKADPETADIPVILVTALLDQSSKMTGLELGADDYLCKPVDEVTLLARVRSLLRAHETQRELKARESSCECLGLAEAMAEYQAESSVALIAPTPQEGVTWKRALDQLGHHTIQLMSREDVLQDLSPAETADLYVIPADLGKANGGLRLLSDLRSRPNTRHSAAVVILPEGDSERGAVALDLGAADILYDPFDPEELVLRIKTQMRRKQQSDRLRASVRKGLELAVRDSLTGLHNRRFAQGQLNRFLANPGRGVAVMMLDLDHFKRVNDRFGHAAGDKVLAVVAERLRSHIRTSDLVARLGGEEFLVALRDTDCETALKCAERLRQAVGSVPIHVNGNDLPVRVTLSVGMAIATSNSDTPQALLERADRALYGSKSDGRNVVTFSASAA